MTERIVDDLEAVEVDEHNSEFLTVASPDLDRIADRLAEHQSVRQPGEIVMGGQEPRARLGLLALGHIFKDYHPSAIRHRLLGKRDDPTFWQWTFGVGSDAAGQSRLYSATISATVRSG